MSSSLFTNLLCLAFALPADAAADACPPGGECVVCTTQGANPWVKYGSLAVSGGLLAGWFAKGLLRRPQAQGAHA